MTPLGCISPPRELALCKDADAKGQARALLTNVGPGASGDLMVPGGTMRTGTENGHKDPWSFIASSCYYYHDYWFTLKPMVQDSWGQHSPLAAQGP